jgi:hypothetical protein
MAKRSGERVPSRESGEAGEGQTRAAIAVVIAGLDPAIHPVRKKVLRRRWTRGSSPRVTKELRERDAPLTRLAPSALATLSPLRGARVRSARVNVRMARRDRG